MSGANQRVQQKDIAEIFDVSSALISKRIKDGTLPKGGTLGEMVRAFLACEIEMLGGAAGNSEWQAERTALMKLRRQIAELDFERAKGKLAPLNVIQAFLGETVSTVRGQFLQLAGLVVARASHMLATRESQADMYALIDHEVRRTLTWLADNADRLTDEVEARAVVPETPLSNKRARKAAK